jgi:hypothetical protein
MLGRVEVPERVVRARRRARERRIRAVRDFVSGRFRKRPNGWRIRANRAVSGVFAAVGATLACLPGIVRGLADGAHRPFYAGALVSMLVFAAGCTVWLSMHPHTVELDGETVRVRGLFRRPLELSIHDVQHVSLAGGVHQLVFVDEVSDVPYEFARITATGAFITCSQLEVAPLVVTRLLMARPDMEAVRSTGPDYRVAPWKIEIGTGSAWVRLVQAGGGGLPVLVAGLLAYGAFAGILGWLDVG